MKNIPKVIYLQLTKEDAECENFESLSRVSWCEDCINETDIKYVLENHSNDNKVDLPRTCKNEGDASNCSKNCGYGRCAGELAPIEYELQNEISQLKQQLAEKEEKVDHLLTTVKDLVLGLIDAIDNHNGKITADRESINHILKALNQK